MSAVVLDAVGTGWTTDTGGAGGWTISGTHSAAGGSDCCVLIGVDYGSSTTGFLNTDVISFPTVTYDGAPCMLLSWKNVGVGDNFGVIAWFVIWNPPTGAKTINIVATTSAGSPGVLHGSSISFKNVGGVNRIAHAGTAATSSPTTGGVPTAPDRALVHLGASGSTSFSGYTGGTLDYSQTSARGVLIGHRIMATGETSATFSWSSGSSGGNSSIVVELFPTTETGLVGIRSIGSGARNTGSSSTLSCAGTHLLDVSDGFTLGVVAVVVSVSNNDATGVIACTWGGTSMALMTIDQVGSGASRAIVAMFGLPNPPNGDATISVTTGGGSTKSAVAFSSLAYTGFQSVTDIGGVASSSVNTGGAIPAGVRVLATASNGSAFNAPAPGNDVYRTGSSVGGVGDYINVADAVGSGSIVYFPETTSDSTPFMHLIAILPFGQMVGAIGASMSSPKAFATSGQTAQGTIAAKTRAAIAAISGGKAMAGSMAMVMQKALASESGLEITQYGRVGVVMRAPLSALAGDFLPGAVVGGAPRPGGAFPWNFPVAWGGATGEILTPSKYFDYRRTPMGYVVSPTQIVTLRTFDGVQLDQYLGSDQISLTWSRELRETSRCDLTIQSHIGSNSRIPDITPWLHWLDVWDDQGRDLLWTGPIQKFSGDRTQLVINARDLSSLASRTRVPMTKRWEVTDPATIAGELYAQMIEHHGLNAESLVRTDPLGDRYSFASKADDGQMDKTMSDLVGLGLSWTIVSGTPVLGPCTRTPVAALDDEDFIGGAGVTITRDGTNSYNDILLRSTDNVGYAKVPMGGLALQQTYDIDSVSGVGNTERATKQYAAYVGKIRNVITMNDGAILNPQAPIDIDSLIPGARFHMSAYGMIFLMQFTRVEVSSGSQGATQVSVSAEVVDDDLPELVTLSSRKYGGGTS